MLRIIASVHSRNHEIGLKCIVLEASFSSKMIFKCVLWYGADDKYFFLEKKKRVKLQQVKCHVS